MESFEDTRGRFRDLEGFLQVYGLGFHPDDNGKTKFRREAYCSLSESLDMMVFKFNHPYHAAKLKRPRKARKLKK